MPKSIFNNRINLSVIVSIIPVILFLIAFANILKDLQLSENMIVNVLIGYGVIFLYRVVLRFTIFKYYYQGMKRIKASRYLEGIESFREQQDFFTAFGFLNQYHAILLLTMSRYSPIEKSLLRMAYCYNMKRDVIMEKKCYEECLKRFPKNQIAKEAIDNMH